MVSDSEKLTIIGSYRTFPPVGPIVDASSELHETLSIDKSVAEKHGLRENSYVRDKAKVMQLIRDSSLESIARCQLNIAIDQFEKKINKQT